MSHTIDRTATLANLEAAFAGESMAHIKYRWFARIAREHGDEETALLFEQTAEHEVAHALGHASMLFPKASLNPKRVLELAIEGETHEYTTMYPSFRTTALEERDAAAVAEFDDQIAESREHAQAFQDLLTQAAKRFAGLATVEERHAKAYEARAAQIND